MNGPIDGRTGPYLSFLDVVHGVSSGRGVLGIVGCPILEDEIVYAIEHDADVSTVHVVESEESRNLIRKLSLLNRCPPVERISLEDLDGVDDGAGFRILVLMKSMALHEDPQRLRKEVLSAVEQIAPHCSSVLLFYGLCGNAFKSHPGEGCQAADVHILCDQQGKTVDDCIAAVLGGTDGYYNLLRRYPGVFYLTPAWAENWRDLITKMEITRGMEGGDLATLKWMFDLAGYRKALKLDTGLGDRGIYEEKVEEFVRTFNFETASLEKEFMTLDVIDRSYAQAKDSAVGNGRVR